MRTVLEVNKRPQVAADVPHTYTDKYLLAEFVTRCVRFWSSVCGR